MYANDLIAFAGLIPDLCKCAGIKPKDPIKVKAENGVITIKRTPERELWILENFTRFQRMDSTYVVHDNFVIVEIKQYSETYLGAACCGKRDEFDLQTGIAVATARAFGIKIPDFI